MPRFDFVSPGAAASAEIQKLLATRAITKRQALLDQLAQEDLQHKWADQLAGQDINKRNATVNELNAQTNATGEGRLGRVADDEILRAGIPFIPQDAPEESITDEALKRYLKPKGAFIPAPGQTPVTSSRVFGPGGVPLESDNDVELVGASQAPVGGLRIFAGNAAQQKERADDARRAAALVDPDIASNEGLRQTVKLSGVGVNTNPTAHIGPAPVQHVIKPGGGAAPSIPLGRNDPNPIELNYQPLGPAIYAPAPYNATDLKGNKVVIVGTPEQIAQKSAEGYTNIQKIGTESNVLPSINSQQLLKGLVDAAKIPNATRRAEAEGTAKSAIRAWAAERGASEAVMDDVDNIMATIAKFEATGNQPPTITEIMRTPEIAALPQREQAQIRSLITSLSGAQ